MSEKIYLKRLFQKYYKENNNNLPLINQYDRREFGYIPWEKQTMFRHIGFNNPKQIKRFFIESAPKHAYLSGSLYFNPEVQVMDQKGYLGCDLIIDIDVDHFYTPCKEDHDIWHCKACGEKGYGMLKKCPQCGKLQLESLSWICEHCLNTAKNEVFKIINDFLIPDFGIDPIEVNLAFSGHRGYHIKIENEKVRTLSSEERREIADYLTGQNISFEVFGLTQHSNTIYGLFKESIGWPHKIITKIEEILNKPNDELKEFMLDKRKFDINPQIVNSLLNYKDNFLQMIKKNQKNIWSIEGFGLKTWGNFLKGIVKEIAVEIDIPVTIDIHRLIRYPGSLHGKTGFKVQEIHLDELDKFNPLDESIERLDPIVFASKNVTNKLEIIEEQVPLTKIKGEVYGPYKKGDIVEVPHHIAIFLLCKEVAKMK
jgi:DNA primase small subunit